MDYQQRKTAKIVKSSIEDLKTVQNKLDGINKETCTDKMLHIIDEACDSIDMALRFLELIKPEFTHVLVDGKIVLSGGRDLYEKIDTEGYDWIYSEFNINPIKQETPAKTRVSIGSCAIKETIKG